jgi:hypothetical protein
MRNALQHHENQQTTQLNTKAKQKRTKKTHDAKKNTRSKIKIMLKQHKKIRNNSNTIAMKKT